ncbi:MAG: hypothetical protein ACJAT5_000852 [Lentimonas sp.]
MVETLSEAQPEGFKVLPVQVPIAENSLKTKAPVHFNAIVFNEFVVEAASCRLFQA